MGKWRCLIKLAIKEQAILGKVIVVKAGDILEAMKRVRYYSELKAYLQEFIPSVKPIE